MGATASITVQKVFSDSKEDEKSNPRGRKKKKILVDSRGRRLLYTKNNH